MDGPVQTLNGLAGIRNSNDDRPLTPSKLVWLGTTNVVLRTYARGARRIVRGGGEDSAARSAAAKKGGGLTEQGALATGKLHKQVMPFVLRRTKDEVLKDLHEKQVRPLAMGVLCRSVLH